jgi:hypothetical protein
MQCPRVANTLQITQRYVWLEFNFNQRNKGNFAKKIHLDEEK